MSRKDVDFRAGYDDVKVVNSASPIALTPNDCGKLIRSERFGQVQSVVLPDLTAGAESAFFNREGMYFEFDCTDGASIQLSTFDSNDTLEPEGGDQLRQDWYGDGDGGYTSMTSVFLDGGRWRVYHPRNGTIWYYSRMTSAGLFDHNMYGGLVRVATLEQSRGIAPTTKMFFTWRDGDGFRIQNHDTFFVRVLVLGQMVGDAGNLESLKGVQGWSGEMMFGRGFIIGGTLTPNTPYGPDAAKLEAPNFNTVIGGPAGFENSLSAWVTVVNQVDAKYVLFMSGAHCQGTQIGS
jgi:hypothetical protein